jgi:hypothetical protein
MHLFRKLFSLQMDSADNMQTHLAKFDGLRNQINAIRDESLPDDILCHALLASVGPEYESLVIALGSRADQIDIEGVKAQLLAEYARQKESVPKYLSENVLLARAKSQH